MSINAFEAWLIISIHAPPRGATMIATFASIRNAYFNSRPSARGDVQVDYFTFKEDISIHAPPRGATDCV